MNRTIQLPTFAALLLVGVAATAQQPLDTSVLARLAEYIRAHYQSPEDYVLSKFEDHDIVFLGEWHRVKHDPELVQRLIARLPEAGVYFLGIEFARRIDQPLVDSLIRAPDYDERLAALILFKHDVFWGYQEYADIFKAAWRFNRSRPQGAREFRILGLNNAPDWSHIRSEKDRDRPRVMTKVWHGETEKDWAEVLVKEVLTRGDKALVYCGRHHAFTEYRQPRVARGKFYGFGDMRVGNHIFQKIGKRAITICLHAPWFSAEGYDKPQVLAADGYIDAVLALLEPQFQRAGFDVAGTPFGELPGETGVYKHGYSRFKLKMIYDGYICQGPLSSYKGVTPIPGFVNETNLHEARAQSPSPQFRNATAEDFMKAIVEAAEIPRQLCHLTGAQPTPRKD
ncbi:MAG: ChaN family lipoprotein [candidate division KSB1 bacterium]|nr:ChaN family lipoprotein [candidate division KSB1 bacterium]